MNWYNLDLVNVLASTFMRKLERKIVIFKYRAIKRSRYNL